MSLMLQEIIVSFLFLSTNLSQLIVYLNAILKRRCSLNVFVIYILIKTVIVNILFKIVLADAISSNFIIKNIYLGLIVFTAILSYIVLLYTFNEHFAKIAVISTCVEMFTTIIGYLSRFITNLMVGKVSFYVGAPLYPTDFLLPVIVAIISYFVLKLIKKLAPKLRTWDVKHKKFTMTIFFVYIGFTIYTMHMDIGNFAVYSGYLNTILFLYILVRYVNYYHRTMLWENEMLKKQQHIAKMQYEGVVLQSEQIEHLQNEIDTQMQTVLSLSENAENKSEQIQNYITSLKQRAENISLGMFCDDKNLDFVLYQAVQKCKNKGIEVDFNLQGYKSEPKKSEKLSDDIQKILHNSINKANEKVAFSVATIKGNTVIKTAIDGKEKVTLWN